MSRPASLPEPLWSRAAGAPCRLLMLDYDGTLAPLRVNRHAAVPPPDLLDTLRAIGSSGGTILAVISGRPVAELTRFLVDVNARMFGEHGWEARTAEGRVIRYPLPVACREALDQAAAAARAEPWGGRLEHKRTGLVLHTRGLAPGEARTIESACESLWEHSVHGGLQLRRTDGGIELRARGRSKRTAVRELIAASPRGTLPVYIGDDETDEDAFDAVRSEGFGLLVASETRATRATGWLRSVDEVRVFLQGWLMLTQGQLEAPGRLPLPVRRS